MVRHIQYFTFYSTENELNIVGSYSGLYWSTYNAVARRDGVYTSPTVGCVDFNQVSKMRLKC